MDYSIKYLKNQEQNDFLTDLSNTGRIRPWSEKKMANEILSNVYSLFDVKKSERLKECASFLVYVNSENGKRILKTANFCRVRLCPLCQWRRSLKLYSQMQRIVTGISQEKEYAYIFLTLTVKNCEKDDLNNTIDNMMKAWNRLAGYLDFKKVVKGYYRGMEITHNVNYKSTSFDTFHPHFHVLLAVNKSYFKSKNYISFEKMQLLWQKAMKIEYKPNIDIRKVKGTTATVLAECCKYTTKESEVLVPDDVDLTLETVKILDKVLNNRRFVSFGGVFKVMHKKLNLDDFEDGDFLNLKDEKELVGENQPEFFYAWNTGYRQYILS